MSPAVEMTVARAELSEDYSYRLNILLEEGREDLARKLAAEYERERLALLDRQNGR